MCIYHNEFSARLSVTSILRHRAAALMALSHDATTDSTTISKLARRFLFETNYLHDKPEYRFPATDLGSRAMATDNIRETQHTCGSREVAQNLSHGIEDHAEDSSHDESEFGGSQDSFINPFYNTSTDVNTCEGPVSQFMEALPSAEKSPPEDLPDMFLPGLVIHIVPERSNFHLPLWKCWRTQENECSYKSLYGKQIILQRYYSFIIYVSGSSTLEMPLWDEKGTPNTEFTSSTGWISIGVNFRCRVHFLAHFIFVWLFEPHRFWRW